MIFHMLDLTLDNSTLLIESSTESSFVAMRNFPWSYERITHKLTINLLNNQIFKIGNNYTFSVAFKGSPRDNNVAFYRTSYLDLNGERK